MTNLDELLKRAFDDLSARAPHERELARAIRRRSHWRRVVMVAPIAAALAVIALVSVSVWFRPAGGQAARPAGGCPPLQTAVLPSWARAGFTEPEPRMPFVTSASGHMLGIVFADPLVSPALPNLGNKILWVTDDPAPAGEALHIAGVVEGGTATMQATVDGGPGPSIIDVPTAGCWHFALTWGTHRDSIDIPYAAP